MKLVRKFLRGFLLLLKCFVVSGLWVNSPALASESLSQSPSKPLRIVVTIPPFQSLVTAVTQNSVPSPTVLLTGASSPHHYSLKPSDKKQLENADLVFWGGPSLEQFLIKPLQTLPASVTIVELDKTKGLKLLPLRRNAFFEEDEHHHHNPDSDRNHNHNHDHDHKNDESLTQASDMHFWLDPDNALVLLDEIAEALSKKDPAHRTHYFDNAKQAKEQIRALDDRIKQQLKSSQNKPFIVFHDAYQYFEQHYGLTAVAAISLHPELPLSVARLKTVRQIIEQTKAQCLFKEPQFNPSLVETIAKETGISTGELDPLGKVSDKPGEGYLKLLQTLADSFERCLK